MSTGASGGGKKPGAWARMKAASDAIAERQKISGIFGGVTLTPDGVLRYKKEAQPVAGAAPMWRRPASLKVG